MKHLKFIYLLLLIFLGASCAKDQLIDNVGNKADGVNTHNIISPAIKIAVISDIHYMDPSLLPDDVENNPYFQAYLDMDRKLLEISDPIFRKAVSEIMDEKPDVLLIPGDMSKDGELIDHLVVQGFLQQLENEGIKVYLVPGNNDINNPDAKSFKGTAPTPVPSVTPEEFVSIYGNFGYNEAIYTDPNSLSYICQPCKGLWILGIDAIKYTDSSVSGAINPATLAWIQENMAIANEEGITVLAMMHYGIIEHYAGQNNIEALIEDHELTAKALIDAGVRLILTGHYHANDIVEYTYNGRTLADIQTGSLVTPPSPYRIMKLDDNFLKIETRRITSIDAVLPDNVDFITYSDENITKHMNKMFTTVLHYSFGIPKEDAIKLAPHVTLAFKAYSAGDEKLPPAERDTINDIAMGNYPFAAGILNNLWNDLNPSDNKIHIKLK